MSQAHRLFYSLLLFSFLAVCVAAQAKPNKDEVAVLAANEAFDKAVIAGDIEAYGRVVADDFHFTGTDGAVSNKSQEIERLRSRKVKILTGNSSGVVVKMYGKTAVVTGRFDARFVDSNGKEHAFAERYTAVFVKRGSGWQMVAEQATEIR